jgi:hypothetical protein
MTAANLILLAVLFSLMLLIVQRTERKRRWLAALLLVPAGYVIYRWAIYRGQTRETLIALGVAFGLNLLYWLLIGRRRPPGSGGSIRVIGMDD